MHSKISTIISPPGFKVEKNLHILKKSTARGCVENKSEVRLNCGYSEPALNWQYTLLERVRFECRCEACVAWWPQAAALPASLEDSTLLVMDRWELQPLHHWSAGCQAGCGRDGGQAVRPAGRGRHGLGPGGGGQHCTAVLYSSVLGRDCPGGLGQRRLPRLPPGPPPLPPPCTPQALLFAVPVILNRCAGRGCSWPAGGCTGPGHQAEHRVIPLV